MGLFGFFQKASGYAAVDPAAVARTGAAGQRHAAYHRRIVLVSGLLGLLGAALGVAAVTGVGGDPGSGRGGRGVLFPPLAFGAAGLLSGVAVMCLVAPREFLTGPVGQRWMKLIGTRSVAVARVACLVFGLLVTAPLVGLGLLVTFGE